MSIALDHKKWNTLGLSAASAAIIAVLLYVMTSVHQTWLVHFLSRIVGLVGFVVANILAQFHSRRLDFLEPAQRLVVVLLMGLAFGAACYWLLSALDTVRSSKKHHGGLVAPAAILALLAITSFVWPTVSTFTSSAMPLYMACVAGHTSEASKLLDQGADVNAGCYLGGAWAHDSTPLMVAAENGNSELVELLLDRGADVNRRDSSGYAAIDYATMRKNDGDTRVLKLLLGHGADISGSPPGALHDAAAMALKKKDWSMPKVRFSPFYNAICRGDFESADVLLKAGADMNSIEWDGSTVLRKAVGMQRPDTVRYLLAHGADVNKTCQGCATALGDATDPEMTVLLLQAGADPNRSTAQGDTPLMNAARSQRVKQAQLLLDAGADPNVYTNYGATPLMYTACNGNMELARMLIAKGARVEGLTADHKTLVQWARAQNHPEMIPLFEQAMANQAGRERK